MKINRERYLIVVAFVATALFFCSAYPYHLMRREQMTLFIYDIPYLLRTYGCVGGISTLIGDFVEQFYCIKIIGPIVVSTLLTTIGILSYRITRNFVGPKVSLGIAALIFFWSFLRETETRFLTQYTISFLGYLLCIYIAMNFKDTVSKVCALFSFLMIGTVLFGAPYHKNYGKLIGKPDFDYEKLIAMDIEASNEDWDKVLEISRNHLLYNEACYLHNLAAAMKGELAERLLRYPQNYANGLFLTVSDVTPFSNSAAGELWFHLGNMTLADQSAMVSLQFSPKHTGARYIKRLAMINLISEEHGAAEKYLKMLSKTLFYHKWATEMIAVNQLGQTCEYIEAFRKNLVKTDIVSSSNNYKLILQELIEANPDNSMAREYKLCHNLLTCNLIAFMSDYTPGQDNARIYQEAALIWLNIQYNSGNISEVDFEKYGISDDAINRLRKFYRNPDIYKSTYWYYYTYAMTE